MTPDAMRLALLRDFAGLERSARMLLVIEFDAYAPMSDGTHIVIEARHGDGDTLVADWWTQQPDGMRRPLGMRSTHTSAAGAVRSSMLALKGMTSFDRYMSELVADNWED